MTLDAVVVGAGPAGAASAVILARRGFAVALVHGGAGARHRAESLPGGARPLLRDLGFLEAAERHAPGLGTVSVWGDATPRRREALFDPHGPGWHLDRLRFDADCRRSATEAGAVLVEGPARVSRDGAAWQVSVGETTLRARFAIDATGRAAVVAREAGAQRIRHDRLVAVYAHAEDPEPGGWTHIEAVPDGWWVTARTPGGARLAAFLTDADALNRDLLTLNGFRAHLALAPSLAQFCEASFSRPRGLDAGSATLGLCHGPGWLAIGDAALSVDPLSSQGLMNALYTGLRGGEAAAASLDGDLAAPNVYAARVSAVAKTYLAHRDAFYATEARWPEVPFWIRRQPAREAVSAG